MQRPPRSLCAKTARSIAAIGFTVVLASSGAARAEVDSAFELWAAAFAEAKLTRESGLVAWLDVHARRGADGTVGIVRPGLGYRLSPNFTVYAGYAWIPTGRDDGPTSHEHRIWQQLIWNTPIGQTLQLSWRARLEQRFSQGGDDVALRLRGFGRAGLPLGQTPFVLVLWDEIFVNLNDVDWGPQLGFNQNRLFAGVGLLAFDGVRTEVGYLNNVIHNYETNNVLNHNLALNLFFSF